jgi:hypothetical protein
MLKEDVNTVINWHTTPGVTFSCNIVLSILCDFNRLCSYISFLFVSTSDLRNMLTLPFQIY